MGALDQSPGCPAPRPELSPGCLSCLSVQTKLLRGVSCTETTLVDFEFVHIPAAVYFQTDSSVYDYFYCFSSSSNLASLWKQTSRLNRVQWERRWALEC